METFICTMRLMMPLFVGALGGGLFAFIQFLITRHDEKKNKAISPRAFNQLIALSVAEAQDRLVYLGELYLHRGSITVREWVIYKQMYDPYRELGGNHYAEAIFEKVKKLYELTGGKDFTDENKLEN